MKTCHFRPAALPAKRLIPDPPHGAPAVQSRGLPQSSTTRQINIASSWIKRFFWMYNGTKSDSTGTRPADRQFCIQGSKQLLRVNQSGIPEQSAVSLLAAALLVLAGCSANLPLDNADGRHLGGDPTGTAPADSTIPAIVNPLPLAGPPVAEVEPELYTVVAQDVPVSDLLFTIARDAGINVDVHPAISGQISINAIDQSLPQILERISRQIDLRWGFDESGNLVVEPDSPYWETYRVDYVNVSRSATTAAQISTSIVAAAGGQAGGGAGGGAGGAAGGGTNTSTSSMNQTTTNDFWTTLTANLGNLLQTSGAGESAEELIVANAEAGLISVRATARQHEGIAAFISNVQARSLYQVLIEATVVEVSLSDEYQSGVDWATIGRDNGAVSFTQDLLGGNLATAPTSVLTLDRSTSPDAITATIALLAQFGELRVLSSPKIMALNNQAAMLRVVDNSVYFTIGVQPGVPATPTTAPTPPVYTTLLNTVPVGFAMTVTPQVGENDQVTLNVRPTISRIVRYVDDPNPILAEAGVVNSIPEIQVREIESILKVYSGQIAILGGLMQDSLRSDTDGLPVLSRLPGVRNLFSYRSERAAKTELIVFIRPVVVRQPSLQGDLSEYRNYLPANGIEASTPQLPQGLFSGQRSE